MVCLLFRAPWKTLAAVALVVLPQRHFVPDRTGPGSQSSPHPSPSGLSQRLLHQQGAQSPALTATPD